MKIIKTKVFANDCGYLQDSVEMTVKTVNDWISTYQIKPEDMIEYKTIIDHTMSTIIVSAWVEI